MPSSHHASADAEPRQSHWVDLAMFQLSIIWLADWTPRSLPLILMAIVSAAAYALWACGPAGGVRYRTARLLMAASVAAPLAVFLAAPSIQPHTEFLQILLLIAAGFASMHARPSARSLRAAAS